MKRQKASARSVGPSGIRRGSRMLLRSGALRFRVLCGLVFLHSRSVFSHFAPHDSTPPKPSIPRNRTRWRMPGVLFFLSVCSSSYRRRSHSLKWKLKRGKTWKRSRNRNKTNVRRQDIVALRRVGTCGGRGGIAIARGGGRGVVVLCGFCYPFVSFRLG